MLGNSPLWLTPNRKVHLVDLWWIYGNKCLLGHTACHNPDHYIYRKAKAVTIGKAVELPCINIDGSPQTDNKGNQFTITVYQPVTSTVHEVITIRLFDLKANEAIADWIAEDRQQRTADYKAEQLQLHSLNERRLPIRGQFSGIGKDIFYSVQPQFYLDGMSISGLTLKPFAKVRLASSYLYLYVDLGDSLKPVSKNARHKAIRYGKPLPANTQATVNSVCGQAVRHYLDH